MRQLHTLMPQIAVRRRVNAMLSIKQCFLSARAMSIPFPPSVSRMVPIFSSTNASFAPRFHRKADLGHYFSAQKPILDACCSSDRGPYSVSMNWLCWQPGRILRPSSPNSDDATITWLAHTTVDSLTGALILEQHPENIKPRTIPPSLSPSRGHSVVFALGNFSRSESFGVENVSPEAIPSSPTSVPLQSTERFQGSIAPGARLSAPALWAPTPAVAPARNSASRPLHKSPDRAHSQSGTSHQRGCPRKKGSSSFGLLLGLPSPLCLLHSSHFLPAYGGLPKLRW